MKDSESTTLKRDLAVVRKFHRALIREEMLADHRAERGEELEKQRTIERGRSEREKSHDVGWTGTDPWLEAVNARLRASGGF